MAITLTTSEKKRINIIIITLISLLCIFELALIFITVKNIRDHNREKCEIGPSAYFKHVRVWSDSKQKYLN